VRIVCLPQKGTLCPPQCGQHYIHIEEYYDFGGGVAMTSTANCTVRSIIYYGLLKRRQKSSLNPFPSPDGSFDCSRHTVFLGTNFIEKDFDFDFLAQKNEKNSVFRVSTSTICPTDCG
jgi:hypothetical protein